MSSSDDLEKLIFSRKDTEFFLRWCLGRKIFSREKIQRSFWSDDLEETCFQEKRNQKLFDLMAWRKTIFKSRDTKKFHDLMIWRCLCSRENILRTLFIWWHGTSFFFKKKLLKTLRSNGSDKSYLPENWYKISYELMTWRKFISREMYWKCHDLMTWRKPVFKRRDTKNVMICWFGETYFRLKKTLKNYSSDDVEEAVFQELRY